MFDAATYCGLGIEALTQELKTDRGFHSQVKEICGQRIKREVMAKQEESNE